MTIDDSFIIGRFFGKSGRLNGNFSTEEYIRKNLDKSVMEYLENRYDDSESLRETFLRIYFNVDERPLCPICGKKVEWNGKRNRLFAETCCNSRCAAKLRELRRIEKYGYGNPWETEKSQKKARETKLLKYGDPFFNNRPKSEVTCMAKYGRKTPVSAEIIEKRKRTCIRKYGTDAPAKCDIVKNRMRNTCIERHGVDNYRKSEECLRKIQETKRKNGTITTSKYEKDVYEWLVSEYGDVDIVCQYKDVRYSNPNNGHTYHCDFYIKSLDLFIEIQAYWAHGPHPFDKNNKEDLLLLENIKEKALKKPIYNRYINEWSVLDVQKRNVAISNNLKYFECFDRKITKEKFLNIIKTEYGGVQENKVMWYYCE